MQLMVATYPETTEEELKSISHFRRSTILLYLQILDARNHWQTLVTYVVWQLYYSASELILTSSQNWNQMQLATSNQLGRDWYLHIYSVVLENKPDTVMAKWCKKLWSSLNYSRDAMRKHGICSVWLSVHSSVHHDPVLYQNGSIYHQNSFTTW